MQGPTSSAEVVHAGGKLGLLAYAALHRRLPLTGRWPAALTIWGPGPRKRVLYRFLNRGHRIIEHIGLYEASLGVLWALM